MTNLTYKVALEANSPMQTTLSRLIANYWALRDLGWSMRRSLSYGYQLAKQGKVICGFLS